MAYNNGREDRKWWLWKEAVEKILRRHGVDESTIEEMDSGTSAKITLNNRRIDKEGFEKSLLIPMKQDGLDALKAIEKSNKHTVSCLQYVICCAIIKTIAVYK